MMMNDGDDVDNCCDDNVVMVVMLKIAMATKKLWQILKNGWLRKDSDEDTWSAWHRKWVKSLPEIFDLGMKGALASFPRQIISNIKSIDFPNYPKISYFLHISWEEILPVSEQRGFEFFILFLIHQHYWTVAINYQFRRLMASLKKSNLNEFLASSSIFLGSTPCRG